MLLFLRFLLSGFGGFNQFGEAGGIVYGNVSQNLAVEGDVCLFEAVHEAAVGHVV